MVRGQMHHGKCSGRDGHEKKLLTVVPCDAPAYGVRYGIPKTELDLDNGLPHPKACGLRPFWHDSHPRRSIHCHSILSPTP